MYQITWRNIPEGIILHNEEVRFYTSSDIVRTENVDLYEMMCIQLGWVRQRMGQSSGGEASI
jgi:hypothetical protein